MIFGRAPDELGCDAAVNEMPRTGNNKANAALPMPRFKHRCFMVFNQDCINRGNACNLGSIRRFKSAHFDTAGPAHESASSS